MRVFNFSAGPAALPEPVLERARDEMLDWHGRGMSVMEMSHRSSEFEGIARQAEADLRALLDIPGDYAVLFLQGGASGQFAAVPINLLRGNDRADYVLTGHWSERAIAEARRFARVNVAASSEATHFDRVPDRAGWRLDAGASYVHITSNETIGGVEFHGIPDVGSVPLVADASSNLLSGPLDVRRFGLVYAGAQKNLGPAGVTVVIVRRDLLGQARQDAPSTFDYALQAENGSMYNTPPTYAWYLTGLVLDWVRREGGVDEMARRAQRRSALLYAAIESGNLYSSPVRVADRSRMNVPFRVGDGTLDKAFLAGAEARGLMNLKGHRSVGGMRASLYNAVPDAAVEALVDFMHEFARQHG
jgi:phosphoserine aminotransferase